METPKQHQREELLTKERLIYRRDQRLVLLLRMLVGVFFFGTLSTIPIFIGGGPMATMGLVCFFALMAMAIVHMACFILAKRKRYVLARKIVFPVWIFFASFQFQFFSPTLGDPSYGILFVAISNLFFTVIMLGFISLDMWKRAVLWVRGAAAAYVIGSVVLLMRFYLHEGIPDSLWITVSSCFLLQVSSVSFAKAVVTDLNQLLTESEEAHLREVELHKETERARDTALNASIVKSQFLANMSHELRTPLSAILGYVELIREEADDMEVHEFDSDLTQIKNAASHLHGLINDILDLSKIEAGKLEIVPQVVDFKSLVEDVDMTVKPLMKKNNNHFKLRDKTHLKSLFCDDVRVKQVLLNLLSNASKFTSNGEVSLTLEVQEGADSSDCLLCTVSDSGIGISSEKLQKIFAPFEQADNSTTRKFGGTGLGLPISARLVEMMDGMIDVTSEVGQGSTFCVMLPLLDATFEEGGIRAH